MNELLNHIILQKNDRIAIADEDRKITYQELTVEINEIKRQLLNIFHEENIRLLISGKNKVDFLLLLLSFIDINVEIILIDPKSSISELNELINNIDVNYIVYENNLFDNDFLASTNIQTKNCRYNFSKISNIDIIPKQSKVYFTSSGSTGLPKIFGFTQKQLLAQFLNVAAHLKFSESDESLCPLTITHSHGLQISIPILLHGGCVHYLSPENCKPEIIIQYVKKNKITLLTGVPYQYNLMLNADITSINPFQTLRYCLCGSAPMSKYLASSFFQKFGIRLNQAYGLSEIGPICFNLEVTEGNFTSVGKVINEIEYKIIDAAGNEIQNLQEGELIVRATFMCNEYINDTEATNSTFIGSWLYTKDIVRIDDKNNMYIIGRKSNFINVSGYKVYPIEIEKVLLNMDGIKEAVVVGLNNREKGQIIKAYVATFFSVDEESIRSFCKKHLPIYKVPHIIQIEDELIQTSIHKVNLKNYINGI